MPEPGAGFDGVAHGVDAGAMPLDARQVALRRPSAVAVHDDGDVRRQPLEVELCRRAPGRDRRPESTPAARHATRGMSLVCKQLIIVHANEEQTLGRRRRARLRACGSGRAAPGSRPAAASRVRPRPASRRSPGPCDAGSRRPRSRTSAGPRVVIATPSAGHGPDRRGDLAARAAKRARSRACRRAAPRPRPWRRARAAREDARRMRDRRDRRSRVLRIW